MRPLCPRDRRRGGSNSSGKDRFHLNLQVLAMQMLAGVSLVPSGPVSPEKRSRANRQRVKQNTHLAWFCRSAPIPLALLPQRARATRANAGAIHHPQTTIMLSPVLMGGQDVACWTAKGPIWLEGKIGSREAVGFPGGRGGGWSIS